MIRAVHRTPSPAFLKPKWRRSGVRTRIRFSSPAPKPPKMVVHGIEMKPIKKGFYCQGIKEVERAIDLFAIELTPTWDRAPEWSQDIKKEVGDARWSSKMGSISVSSQNNWLRIGWTFSHFQGERDSYRLSFYVRSDSPCELNQIEEKIAQNMKKDLFLDHLYGHILLQPKESSIVFDVRKVMEAFQEKGLDDLVFNPGGILRGMLESYRMGTDNPRLIFMETVTDSPHRIPFQLILLPSPISEDTHPEIQHKEWHFGWHQEGHKLFGKFSPSNMFESTPPSFQIIIRNAESKLEPLDHCRPWTQPKPIQKMEKFAKRIQEALETLVSK